MAAASEPRKPTQARPASLWLPELDGLRAVACFGVMLGHFGSPFQNGGANAFSFANVLSIHLLGVAFFFCLSAFLLTMLARIENEKSGDISIKYFYFRRGLRIYPLYFFYFLVVWVSVSPRLGLPFHYSEDSPDWQSFSRSWWTVPTFTVNWATALNSYGHIRYHVINEILILWSLSVEEQFYLIFPLLVILAIWKPSVAKYLIMAALFIAYSSRILFFSHPNSDFGGMYFATTSYLDIFASGAVAGWLFYSGYGSTAIGRLVRKPGTGILLVGSLVGLGALWNLGPVPPYHWTAIPIYSALGIAMALSLLWVLENRASLLPRFCRLTVVRYLGKISYGMYLWHHFVNHNMVILVFNRVLKFVQPRYLVAVTLASFTAFYVCTALLASVTYFVIERPFLRLRHRRFGVVSRPNAELKGTGYT
jgi:peptidoglycan/LPS O-acetylase OafA/YrhL